MNDRRDVANEIGAASARVCEALGAESPPVRPTQRDVSGAISALVRKSSSAPTGST
jgi:hypothetical protein